MKIYCVIMADGTFADIRSECFIQEDSCISFVYLICYEDVETVAYFIIYNIAGFYYVR